MLNTVKIYGLWDEGIVLDNHMKKSIFIGYDENGKEKFENTRTELGELLYRFKYKKEKECLYKIVNMIIDILKMCSLEEKVDVIIPVPPSNKGRKYQPVFELAKEISKILKKECKIDILIKESNQQSKDKNNVSGTIRQINAVQKLSNILVVDDLYSTGATLNEVCRVLRKDRNVNKIYCLVLTKTKG